MSAYARPGTLDEAVALLASDGVQPLAGGTDLVPLQSRGKAAGGLVDVRGLLGDAIETQGDGLVIGAATRVADVAADAGVAERYAALAQAARLAAAPQLRNQGTVAGNLAQHVRCWYFRHPDLTCWLAGGDTCYAQIGDHRKHGLEAGDCISVAPSDLAAALLALDASVHVTGPAGERSFPLAEPLCAAERGTPLRRPARARRADHRRRAARAAGCLGVRARRRARRLVVRARGHRRGALRRLAAAGGDRASRTSRACSTPPIRSPVCPVSSRPAGSASSQACCASARSPASPRDNPRRGQPTTSR